MAQMKIEDAREYVAGLAEKESEIAFAREVRAGAWDHRKDVQSALLRGPFEPRKLTGAASA